MFYPICLLFLLSSVYKETTARDERIVGGKNVTVSEYSYQLAMNTNKTFCGASVISANWALTAAHCFVSANDTVVLRAGSSSATSGGTVHNGIEIHINPNYNKSNQDYDIALVKVSPPFTLGSNVSAVPLASSDSTFGTQAVITGWGSTSMNSNTLSSSLKAAKLRIRARIRCTFISTVFGRKFTDRMICAGGLFKTSCNGDSGGPLVNTNTGEQLGVASFRLTSTCIPGLCEFFTSVPKQRDWIKTISGV